MIKENAELRHVLAHMYMAIESLANGQPDDALYELESIRGLVFFDSDEEQLALSRRLYGLQERKMLQGQMLEGQETQEVTKNIDPSQEGL